MATIKELFQNAVKVSPSRRNPPNSASREIKKVIPYRTTNNCLMQFLHGGVTVAGVHQVNMVFEGLDMTEEVRPTSSHFKVRDAEGKVVYVEKPDLATTKVKVRCTCPDFYFTFAYWNWADKCIFGKKPRPYVKKSNRGPRNPLKIPGVCKHVLNSVFLLQTERFTQQKRL